MGAVKIFTNGYIKLYRSLLDWEWYKNSNTKDVFLHCVLKANLKPQKFEGVTIKRGEFVTSIAKLAGETGLTVREVRTALNHLKTTNELTIVSKPQYTIITVNNYDKHQDATNILTNERQTIDKRLTNERQQYKKNKEEKEDKEERESKLTLGEYQNVFLSEIEKQKLVDEFGEELARAKIERLSEYMTTSGRIYKNHYAQIRTFCKQDKTTFFEQTNGKKEDKPAYDISEFEKKALSKTPTGGVTK